MWVRPASSAKLNRRHRYWAYILREQNAVWTLADIFSILFSRRLIKRRRHQHHQRSLSESSHYCISLTASSISFLPDGVTRWLYGLWNHWHHAVCKLKGNNSRLLLSFLLRQKACLTWHVWLEYQGKSHLQSHRLQTLKIRLAARLVRWAHWGVRGTWYIYKYLQIEDQFFRKLDYLYSCFGAVKAGEIESRKGRAKCLWSACVTHPGTPHPRIMKHFTGDSCKASCLWYSIWSSS